MGCGFWVFILHSKLCKYYTVLSIGATMALCLRNRIVSNVKPCFWNEERVIVVGKQLFFSIIENSLRIEFVKIFYLK